MAAENKGATIEENLSQLDKIAAQMSDPDVSLEDSFRLYEEGIRRIRECNDAITSVKQRVEKLEKDGTVTDFESTGS
ncbi:MAG: exodeoxyribonuclease VII small subunit [Lachnospiraceae bacterium]|nr:exodeoxyribonuclease VII small subunit [Lachnospiraceae bacterium]